MERSQRQINLQILDKLYDALKDLMSSGVIILLTRINNDIASTIDAIYTTLRFQDYISEPKVNKLDLLKNKEFKSLRLSPRSITIPQLIKEYQKAMNK